LAWLKQFGSQTGHFAAFTGSQGHVPKASLARKGMDEHGESVIRLTHIRGIDLTGVASEYHFGALADAGEDRFERRRFEVLCFVNHYELLLERSTAKECDRLERELSAIGEVVNESDCIAT
jgi:hypothetical protein